MTIPAKDLLMGFLKQAVAGLGLIGCIWLMAGCAEVVVPGAFTGAGEVYRYNTSNVVKKNINGRCRSGQSCHQKCFKENGCSFLLFQRYNLLHIFTIQKSNGRQDRL